MADTTREQKMVGDLFNKLMGARVQNFPKAGKIEAHAATENRGIYVIHNRRGRVVHVGATPRGKRGIAQRLQDHLRTASSFTKKYPPLKGNGSNLRDGYTFRCLPVPNDRLRSLVEAYAIGYLCPAHIGLHQMAGPEGGREAL